MTTTATIADHAALLRLRGFALCKPDPGTKNPTDRGWSTRSLEADEFAEGDLLGILGGPLSDGNQPGHALVIVDLDGAAALAEADRFLPPTTMEEGRPGKLRSHRYFLVPVASIPEEAHSTAEQGAPAAQEQRGHPGPKIRHFADAATDKNIIDFVGTGGQCVCPPSAHPGGELREWTGGEPGLPRVVAYPELWSGVCRLADACGWKPRTSSKPKSRGPRKHGEAGDVLERARLYLAKCPPAISGQRGHDKTLWAARAMCWGFDLGAEGGFELLRDEYNPRCDPPWSEAELWHKAEDADTVSFDKPRGWLRDKPHEGNGQSCEAPHRRPSDPPKDGDDVAEADNDPHRLARLFLDDYRAHGMMLHRYWREEHCRWDGSAYRRLPEKEVRAELSERIKAEADRLNRLAMKAWREATKDMEKKPPQPTAMKVPARLVSDALHALDGMTLLPSAVEPVCWLDETETPFPAGEALVFRNGIVRLPAIATGDGTVYPATPNLFSLNSLDYDFRPDAPPPVEWLGFLAKLWADDPQSIDTLQEWFGYLLTADTSQQKILLLVGPKRSGKGTIVRVLTRLVGVANVCAPTLAGLGTNFGLWPLLGKTVATISDARLSGRTDTAIVVERLLSISGEDAQTIDRKNLPHVTTRLPVRFVILTNELPRLSDSSGALPGRLIVLQLTRSWYGVEDHGLIGKLLPELPGILLWAVAGWQRLRERGYLVQPESGQRQVRDLEDLSSPVGAFLRECCEIGPGFEVPMRDLYERWKSWCEDAGRKDPGDKQVFGRDLRAAMPAIGERRTRDGKKRIRFYLGLRLREDEPGEGS